MPPEPIPDRGPDEEPDDSSLPGEEWDGPEECLPEDCLPEQGLFVCLPAEELTLEGFAGDGRADTMEPGPLLATVVAAVTGDDAQGRPRRRDPLAASTVPDVQQTAVHRAPPGAQAGPGCGSAAQGRGPP